MKMLERILLSKQKRAEQFLKNIGMHQQTQFQVVNISELYVISHKHHKKAPKVQQFLKVMKKEVYSVQCLLKNCILTHFFMQNMKREELSLIVDFIEYLEVIWDNLAQLVGHHEIRLNTIYTKRTITTLQTEGDEILMGKEWFMLKDILLPYLSYLKKVVTIVTQQKEVTQQYFQANMYIWRKVNLLKQISRFTSNFMYVGRYYFKDYGDLVVLLSQILSKDIKGLVQSINRYISSEFKQLCLTSERQEDKTNIKEFMFLLNEMGTLNQKFTQFYLGKYFYQHLAHIEQPKWLDNNSHQFDFLFQLKM